MLLFPYRDGEPLPVTMWNKERTKLTVEWPDQKDEILFAVGQDGRTRLKLQRDGKAVAGLD